MRALVLGCLLAMGCSASAEEADDSVVGAVSTGSEGADEDLSDTEKVFRELSDGWGKLQLNAVASVDGIEPQAFFAHMRSASGGNGGPYRHADAQAFSMSQGSFVALRGLQRASFRTNGEDVSTMDIFVYGPKRTQIMFGQAKINGAGRGVGRIAWECVACKDGTARKPLGFAAAPAPTKL